MSTKGDLFKLSKGNKKVLELIPSMMEDDKYRIILRNLSIKFLFEKQKRRKKK